MGVASAHLDHRGPEARQRGVDVIIGEGLPSDMPAILAGDFNCDKSGEVYKKCMISGFCDALSSVECQALQCNTFHGFKGGPCADCAPPDRHTGHIDWILARGAGATLRPRRAAVVTLAWSKDGHVCYPSDHLPIAVEFDFEGKDAGSKDEKERQQLDLASRLEKQSNCWMNAKPLWKPARDGMLHPGAVEGGADSSGKFYVGRALHKGILIPGKVCPAHKCCYVPSGCKEHTYREYEVLCLPQGTYRWEGASLGSFPAGAVPCGSFYAARTKHSGVVVPGKLHAEHQCCYVSSGGKEHKYDTYEVLTCDYHSYMFAS